MEFTTPDIRLRPAAYSTRSDGMHVREGVSTTKSSNYKCATLHRWRHGAALAQHSWTPYPRVGATEGSDEIPRAKFIEPLW